jgi:hypothetical protein
MPSGQDASTPPFVLPPSSGCLYAVWFRRPKAQITGTTPLCDVVKAMRSHFSGRATNRLESKPNRRWHTFGVHSPQIVSGEGQPKWPFIHTSGQPLPPSVLRTPRSNVYQASAGSASAGFGCPSSSHRATCRWGQALGSVFGRCKPTVMVRRTPTHGRCHASSPTNSVRRSK